MIEDLHDSLLEGTHNILSHMEFCSVIEYKFADDIIALLLLLFFEMRNIGLYTSY